MREDRIQDRVRGAFVGLALGDTVGVPSLSLSRDAADRLQGGADGRLQLRVASADNPVSAGMLAGWVTAPTEQAVLLGRQLLASTGRGDDPGGRYAWDSTRSSAIVDGGSRAVVDGAAYADRLAAWGAGADAAGRGLLIDSVTRALMRDRQVQSSRNSGEGALAPSPGMGSSSSSTLSSSSAPSSTSGSVVLPWTGSAVVAARSVVCGMAVGCDPVADLVEVVIDANLVAGGGALPVAGAAAVAAAVSSAVDGWSVDDARSLAMAAADLVLTRLPERAAAAGQHPPYVTGPDLSTRIAWATRLAAGHQGDPTEIIDLLVGTSGVVQEAVPAAFALIDRLGDDPGRCVLAAARLGGDTATIGAITGCLLGARHGMSAWPVETVATLLDANPDLHLFDIADALAAKRAGPRTAERTPEDQA